jgi:restriction system protein
MTDAPKAWLTRSGRYGERDAWALENGVTPGGFDAVPDLSGCRSLEDVRQVVAQALPDASPNAVGNFAAQLWALSGRMAVGDYVALPLKATSQLAIGRITGPYEYRADDPDPDKRHVRPVEWLRTDVPRSAVKQDLLYSLGAFLTYCQVSRNEAAARIAAIAATGSDPGSRVAAQTPAAGRPLAPTTVPAPSLIEGDVPDADSEATAFDLEQHAQDRIQALIQERFAGHAMAILVEALLRAQGYTVWRSPEGADGGIDLLAGSGPLGLDAPQLVVQVKSEQSPVGDPVISQLLGTTTKHGPTAQGLLVAWGGLTQPAQRSARDNYFRLRVWTAKEVIAQVTRHYGAIPEEIRTDLPLKQIWIAVEGDE